MGVTSSFRIEEKWMSRLWRPVLPAAIFFPIPFFFMLPLAAPAVPKAAAALILGAGAVLALVHRLKRGHLIRHEREARLLGFSCRVEGSLWNPAARVSLLLEKEPGAPGEDELLRELVLIHGPDYASQGRLFWGADLWAASAAALLAVLMGVFRPSLPLLLPLFLMAALLLLLSETEKKLLFAEAAGADHEFGTWGAGKGAYRRWNFLALEGNRERMGRVKRMEEEIAGVLLGPAGLPAGASVLEVGAGGGFLWKHMPPELRPGWVQAEKDPLAALYCERHRNGTRVHRTDVKTLPFGDASFDALVGLECFDALSPEDLDGVLGEALRLLKPGGRLVHLKDFPDWPGGAIVERFNAFSARALRRPLVTHASLYRLDYAALAPGEAEALAEAAGRERGQAAAYAGVLSAAYSAGPASDPRWEVPMFVSARILRSIMIARGFEVLADCLSPGEPPGVIAYLVARKPG